MAKKKIKDLCYVREQQQKLVKVDLLTAASSIITHKQKLVHCIFLNAAKILHIFYIVLYVSATLVLE